MPLAMPSLARAADNHYSGDTSGKWENAANWSLGAPSSSDTNDDVDSSAVSGNAIIDSVTTVSFPSTLSINNLNISDGLSTDNSVILDADASASVPLDIANALTVDNGASISIYGGAVDTLTAEIGVDATGYGYQTGGSLSVTQDFHLGRDTGGAGYYSLSGGSLSVGETEYVGQAFGSFNASGSFTQYSGSTHTIANGLQIGNQSVGSGAYTMNGGSLSVTNGIDIGPVGTFTQSGGTVTTLNGGGFGDLTLDGSYEMDNTNLSDPAVLSVAGSEYIGDTGNGSFVQTGGTNTAAGNITIARQPGSTGSYSLQGGTLSGQNLINNGTLTIYSGATFHIAGTISGTGTIIQNDGTSTYANQTTIDQGSVQIAGGTATGAGSLLVGADAGSSGSLAISGGTTTITGDLGVGNNGTITGGASTASGSVTVSAGTLTTHLVLLGNTTGGSGTLQISGTGNVELDGLNMNDLTVNNGSLQVVSQAAQPGDDPEIVGALVGGYMRNGAMTVSGGTVTSPVLKLGVTSGFTGTYTQTGGAVTVTTFGDGNDASQTSGAGIGTASISGGTLDAGAVLLGSSAGGAGSATFSGSSSINVTNDMYVGAASGSGTVSSSGNAQIAIGGILSIGGTGGSGDVTVGGSSSWDPGGAHLNDLTVKQNGNFVVTNQPTPQGADPVINASIVGGYQYNGALNVQDSATVTAPNIKLGVTSGFTGTMTQTGGTTTVGVLGVGNDGTETGGAGIGVANISGGTLSAATIDLGSSAGGVGTLQLGSAANVTASDGTTISSGSTLGGVGTLDSNVTSAGEIAPGDDPGTLNISGNLISTGAIDVQLASLTTFDQLDVSGNANLGGTIGVSLLDGYQPLWGQTFTIMNFNSFTNSGYTLDLTHWLDGSTTLSASNTDNSLTITVVPEPTTGGLLAITAFGALTRRRRARMTKIE
ncbi:MAG: PEP-CTERM sorting domain-containing protein [Tepidisphaeraceae bacterium]|jgi:hypothetical protein